MGRGRFREEAEIQRGCFLKESHCLDKQLEEAACWQLWTGQADQLPSGQLLDPGPSCVSLLCVGARLSSIEDVMWREARVPDSLRIVYCPCVVWVWGGSPAHPWSLSWPLPSHHPILVPGAVRIKGAHDLCTPSRTEPLD